MLRRDLGVTGAGFALVMAAGLFSYSLSGLVHGPGQADEPGVLSPRPTVTVTATPAAAPTSSASSPGASPGFPAEPVSARAPAGTSSAPVTSRPTPHPTSRPTPAPSPSPSPSKSCPAALLVVLPLTSRPCPLLQIGRSS